MIPPQMPNGERLLTAEQVGELLMISKRSVFRWVREGLLPEPLRYSRKCLRWKASDVQRFLQERDAG